MKVKLKPRSSQMENSRLHLICPFIAKLSTSGQVCLPDRSCRGTMDTLREATALNQSEGISSAIIDEDSVQECDGVAIVSAHYGEGVSVGNRSRERYRSRQVGTCGKLGLVIVTTCPVTKYCPIKNVVTRVS